MRSTTSTPTANLSTTSAASTSPNAAVTRGGSPPGADDADSRSSSHSDTEGGQKPSLTSKIATTPSLPELVPPQPYAQLKKSVTALVDMLLNMQAHEARQTGKELQESWKDCVRNGLHGHELRGIQEICLKLLALSGRREGLGLGKAEQGQFDQLVDDVFHASNNADATLPEDHGTSRKEKDDEETPSKKRVKRKVRSGEAPGSGGADKKKSKKSEFDISIPKLTSPYPATTTTTANSGTSSTSTATTSTALGASTSHSASTDSPPLSPRRGLDVAASVSPTGLNADSTSLLGRIERNLSTLTTQFETLCGFGLAIIRSDWSEIQEAQEIVKSLLAPGGLPASQFGRANELDKLRRAIKSLNTALQSSRESAEKLKHRDFRQEDFQILARRMGKLLKSIQLKLSTLQTTDEQLKSPSGGATGTNPGDAVTRLRSPSGGAKAPPSLSTFGRKAGKSIFTSTGPDSSTPVHGDAPLSPRSARRSMLVSVPVANLKMTTQGALTSTTTTTATTTTTTNVASSASPRAVSTLMAPPTVKSAAPHSSPTSPRFALKPQPQPLRLRGGPTPQSNAGATDQSIATLKAALGKYSMRNLMQGFAIEGSSVVPTGPASSNTSAAIAAMPPPAVVGSAVQPPADLRALLSGPSARNLLQRFRIDGDNVVVSSEAQTRTVVSNLPTQGSGDLSDADIAELVKKVEGGDDNLLQSLIQSLEEALGDPAVEQSIDDTVILTSSSDESDISL